MTQPFDIAHGNRQFHFAPLLYVVLLLAIVIAIYWRGLAGGYTFDDFPNIVDNIALHVSSDRWQDWWSAAFSSPASDLQRPLAMLTFAANYYFTGLQPFTFKATNLAIHALNAVLALLFARQLLFAWRRRFAPDVDEKEIDIAALAIAALWATATINLVPVLLIVQRMESLAQTFVFCGLILYVHGREKQSQSLGGWLWIFGGLIAYTGVGLLCKESAAELPFYALLIEFILLGFAQGDRALRIKLAVIFILVLGVPFVIGVVWLSPWLLSGHAFDGRPFTLSERLLTESRVLWDYIRWTFAPNLSELSLYHDDYLISRTWLHPATTVLAIAGLIGVAITAFLVRHRRPLCALGLLLFLSAHALTATFIPLELVYEHRNYFASFGLFLSAIDLALLATPRGSMRALSQVVVLAIVAMFSLLTFLRANEWSNPIRFSLSEAEKNPHSPRAQYDAGLTYTVLSRYDPTSPFLEQAHTRFAQAAAIAGSSILPEQGLILLAARTNVAADPDIWDSMRKKLTTQPLGVQDFSALTSLVTCARTENCHLDNGQLLETFLAALKARPDQLQLLAIFANFAANVLDDLPLALRLTKSAVEQSPRNAQYLENLANVLIADRQFDAAAQQIVAIRGLNRFGTQEARVDSLESRLTSAKASANQQSAHDPDSRSDAVGR